MSYSDNGTGFQDKVSFIWQVADLLRGDYKQSEYGKVILPLTVLRRLDCVLAKTKQKVLDKAESIPKKVDDKMRDTMLCHAAGLKFYNLSLYTFERLKADPDGIGKNLRHYINGFSANVREVFADKFEFFDQIDRLEKSNLLYMVVNKFVEMNFHPDKISNHEMGYIFEELIRKFSELSNETAGEHFTPREVIRLMVDVLLEEDDAALTKPGVIRTLYDCACGTGGMLSVAEDRLRSLHPKATLKVFGQELNAESYGVCKSDLLIKGQEEDGIKFGNSFTQDGLPDAKFDYMLSNPPFGVEWKKVEKEIREEADSKGFDGRFGAGLPRVSDGSLLFLQHMIFKRKPEGSRLAIVFNGSPLFTGGAGSGESEIRRWIIEQDWLEAIIALPDQLFYNTGISTYIWVVTNRKSKQRRGKIQLINAVSFSRKMRKSLGNKRNEISPDQIEQIVRIYGDFEEGEFCKIFDNEDFGYNRITVERPLRLNFAATAERLSRLQEAGAFKALATSKKKGKAGQDEIEEGQKVQQAILQTLKKLEPEGIIQSRDSFSELLKKALKSCPHAVPPAVIKAIMAELSERDETAEICRDSKGNPEPDADLRDFENVPLKEDIHDYFKREVLPHVPDAWIDEEKTKKGYEIPFTRHFYQYTPLRPLEVIEAEIMQLEDEIQGMMKGVIG